jgi:hypothetical protein
VAPNFAPTGKLEPLAILAAADIPPIQIAPSRICSIANSKPFILILFTSKTLLALSESESFIILVKLFKFKLS